MAERPNFVWINTHDVSARNLGCYGDDYATTPHLDKLAEEGVRYANAFACGPICSPARTSIFTGMHQTTVGTHHHRSFARRPDFVQMLPHYLMAAGYNCSAINTDLNTDIDPDEWAAYQSNEALLAQADEKPFFAVYSFGESHASIFKLTPEQAREQRSNLLTDEELHDPDNAPLPVFMPETPLARERTALFYDGLMQVDRHVGEVIENLVSAGVLDNTIVFFWADHGTGFPRGKTHVYDDGLRVPLIIRFPDKYQHLAPGPPGTVVDNLVMTMDMGASVLSMMDVQIPKHFQGRAFLGKQREPYRDYVCGARDRLDNCNEVIRTIRNEKHRYIRNFLPHRPYASFWPDGGFFATPPEKGTPEHDFWDTSCLPGKQKVHDPDGVFLLPIPEAYSAYLIWQAKKPFEELYDVENDPEEIANLADDPEYSDLKDQMRTQLFAWMIETRDLGLIDETEMIVRAAEYDGVNYEVGAHCENYARILETADFPRLGEVGRTGLINRLDDPDSAVRYWAITGLMSYEVGDTVLQRIGPLVRDESLSVSLAAADLLCQNNRTEGAIPALERALQSDLLWARFRASANLSFYNRVILAQMKALIPALQAALDNPVCYGPFEPAGDELIPPVQTRYRAQKNTIVGEWVLQRVIKRVELA
ncbi:MAG: sulfatase-like hydrolase/transferase [Gemmatimonadetes bacterium]|nr:sulfatase-like hydrolase/transferase [Gemmatimonadota bacterium]